MAESARSHSLLFRRLRLAQRALPLVASIPVTGYELVEHEFLARPVAWRPFLTEVSIYGFIVPLVIFAVLTWLLERVRERDEAEARLRALYEVTRQSASMSRPEALQELALDLPERAGVADPRASLIVQDAPGGRWLLAGSRGLSADETSGLQQSLALDALASESARPGDTAPRCTRFEHLEHAPSATCPLLETVCRRATQTLRVALCLSLSRDPSRQVLLTLYAADPRDLPRQVIETLDSMAAGLTIALDRAQLQVRERQLLRQVERAVESEQLGLVPTLQTILAEIATEHSLAAGAVFLLRRGAGSRHLAATACWPGPVVEEILVAGARESLRAESNEAGPAAVSPLQVADAASSHRVAQDRVEAVRIASEGEPLGMLVLAARPPGCLPERSTLGVVASVMALVIRNSELYAQLQSQAIFDERDHLAREVHDGLAQSLGFLNFKIQQVQRLLGRGEVDRAAVALQELREGNQEVYAEARQMILDLQWAAGEQGGLIQRLEKYGAVFAARTGLAISVEAEAEPELSQEAQRELFRVAQEALNNVHRHAHARCVTVRLARHQDGTTLVIEDDGRGVALPDGVTGGHFGMRIMHERAQSIGGELRVASDPGKGTSVCVHVPLAASQDAGREEL